MSTLQSKFEDIREGDTISVVVNPLNREERKGLYSNQVVTYCGPTTIVAGNFHFQKSMCHFFLVKRAKQPLPTAIGSVVEVDGLKFVRVQEDNESYAEWGFSRGGFISDRSSEKLSELDYTIV